jgi:hypothetical protein
MCLAVVWCLTLHAEGARVETDRLVVTFFQYAVRQPKILGAVQVTNGFSVVRQYERQFSILKMFEIH